MDLTLDSLEAELDWTSLKMVALEKKKKITKFSSKNLHLMFFKIKSSQLKKIK